MTRRTSAGPIRQLTVCACAVGLAIAIGLGQSSTAAQRGAEPGETNRGQGAGPAPGRGRANYSLSDPAPNDPALKGAIDMHAHQDPDSFGPSYGQAARSIDALDLYTRAKASGMTMGRRTCPPFVVVNANLSRQPAPLIEGSRARDSNGRHPRAAGSAWRVPARDR